MSSVAVVGAGPLGANVAYLLARRDVAGRIDLIDQHADSARGKALDIMQAAPVEGFAAHVSGSADTTRVVDASLVLLADDAQGAVWEGETGSAQLMRLRRLAEGRPVVCADASHRLLVERGVRELGFARHRLFGSAPEALASATRAMVALEVSGSPRDITVVCLGVPPSDMVVPWEHVSTAAGSALQALDGSSRRRLESHLPALWPPGPIALAAAAVEAAAATLGLSRRHLMAFVAPDDRMGQKWRTSMWPVALSSTGIVRVLQPVLSGHEQTRLDTATGLF